ncbi:hypothetical protein AB0K52_22245 [Glycomyces sp. NPDC049804]|uniref:hypothetical protein n=1 Tax=Glycomyces sp. NPDC049804 TaxID=3154363 RepID=UPI0034352C6D
MDSLLPSELVCDHDEQHYVPADKWMTFGRQWVKGRVEGGSVNQFIAVFEDHDGGRRYISRDELPGFITDDIEMARRFESARNAELLAEAFTGITISAEGSDDVWQPRWIARTYAERIER